MATDSITGETLGVADSVLVPGVDESVDVPGDVVAVGDGDGEGDTLGVAEGVELSDGVSGELGVGVAEGDAVSEAVGVGVAEGDAVSEEDGVGVAEGVDVPASDAMAGDPVDTKPNASAMLTSNATRPLR